MGVDGAGVVEAVDDDEPLLRPGQPVVLHPGIACGRCAYCLRGDDVLCTSIQLLGEHRDGSWAQYVALPARNVLPRPPGLGAAEAAALGVAHLTAWRMLFTQARLQPWETVLIFGSLGWFAGGIGSRLQAQPALAVWLDRCAGTIFFVLALHLANATR